MNDNTLYSLGELNSRLFIYYLDNMKKVIKILGGYEIEDKEYILDELYRNRKDMPNEFVIPEYLVKGDSINGYIIPFIEGNNLSNILNNKDISLKEKIYYLKKVGNLLEKLKEYEDLHINDLHEDNILVNRDTRDIKVIDVDGIKINNSISFPAKYLRQFSLINNSSKYRIIKSLEEYVKADRNTDLYCYSIMILNYFAKKIVDCMSVKEFNNYLNRLNDIGMSKELIDIFARLIDNEDNINPAPYLDSLTEEQVLKAKL